MISQATAKIHYTRTVAQRELAIETPELMTSYFFGCANGKKKEA